MPMQGWLALSLLLLVTLEYQATSFITPHVIHTKRSFSLLKVSSSGDGTNGQSLYDILGASPEDSHAQLKQKYNQLVRKIHPDAVGKNSLAPRNGKKLPEFGQVTAAWRVLQNPKERKRYDRELKAKELTENFGVLLDVGIRAAVPFLKKTANSTIAAVETSSHAVQDMSQKMGNAMEVFELDQKSKTLEQQAAKDIARAEQLKNQLETQEERRLNQLSTPNAKLTSSEALGLLKRFHAVPETSPTSSDGAVGIDIEALGQVEKLFKEKKRECQVQEKNAGIAEREAANAVVAETVALDRLEQAKLDLEQARSNIKTTESAAKKAKQTCKAADVELEKVSFSLERKTEIVRTALRHQEGESMKREATFFKQERARLNKEAKEMRSKAQQLKIQSENLKREQQAKEKEQQG